MPAQVIQTFSRKSGKTIAYIESIWKDLKDEYGNDYKKIVGVLKKILNIDEEKIEEILYKQNLKLSSENRHDNFRPVEKHLIYKTKKYKLYDINKYIILTDSNNTQLFYIKINHRFMKNEIVLGARENLSNEKGLFFKVIYTLLYLGYKITEDVQHNDLSIKSLINIIKAGVITVKYNNKNITNDLIKNKFNDDEINKTFSFELKNKSSKYLLENKNLSIFKGEDLFNLSDQLIKNTIIETKGTYVCSKVQNHEELSKWFQDQGLKTIPSKEMHCTIAYSKKEFKHNINKEDIKVLPKDLIEIAPLGDDGCVVLKFKSKEMTNRWQQCMDEGAMYDYPEYISHTTIALDVKDKELINNLKVPDFPITFGEEIVEELDLDWKNKLKENEMNEAAMDLEKIYSNIKNPYDNITTNISGIDYDKLDDIDVKAGIMFYAINANGTKVSTRLKTNIRAKEVMIAGKEYVITNKLSYPGKKYIKEIMIARKSDIKESEMSEKIKVGDKLTTNVKKGEVLFNRTGIVKSIKGDMAQVDFGNSDVYGITLRRIKNSVIVEAEETYKEFFAKKLEKYDVKSPAELSDEDKQKFFDEVDAEWEGEKEDVEELCSKDKKEVTEEVNLSTKALYELSKGNSAEFISIVKDAMFIEVGKNDKYPGKD